MSAHPPSVAAEPPTSAATGTPQRSFLRVQLLAAGAALVVGIGAGIGVFLLHRPAASGAAGSAAVATWPPGARPAPGFLLADQNGTPFTLRSLRGRPAIVTFVDPLCRDFCTLEARVLTDAVRQVPAAERPVIVGVSVNPRGDTRTAFHEDVAHWRLSSDWRWGVGSPAVLAHVWRRYDIAVDVSTRTIAGVRVHEISHTAAAYVVDAAGDERALFLYPFRAADVAAAVRRLGPA